jgi:glycosyltransferase involved in cell wall biosynthesis
VLVLPGFSTPHEQDLRALAQDLGVAQRLRLPDWLSESALAGLYALSSAFVLPSLVEGFGLPVLEAMLRDVPVACSNTSSLPEVAGDAALLFDPERQEEVTGAIRRLLDDRALAQRLVERGRLRAEEFTWKHTGAASLNGYRRALAQPGRA